MMKAKVIKYIGITILAIAMFLGFDVTDARALTDGSGRDTDRSVSLTIYKYEHDENIFKGIKNDGLPQSMPAGAKAVEGVTFKIEKVTLKSNATTDLSNPAHYEPITGGGAFSTTGNTDSNGKIVFSTANSLIVGTASNVLPGQGIYKVSEVKSATAGTNAIDDFIVSLPMANPDTKSSDSWLYDIHAYPKNNVQKTIEKEVEKANGNTVTWKYSVIIPDDIDAKPTGNESLTIIDKLDYRLSYVSGSIKGAYTTKDGTAAAVKLDFKKDYKLVLTTGKDSGENPIQILTISITADGFAKLASANKSAGNETPMLYFTFETKTNASSEISDLGGIYNGGELEYSNSAGHEYDKEAVDEADMPKADVYGIAIYKINVNDEALSGAQFTIYASREDAIAGDMGKALKKPDGGTWKVVTDSNGYAYFYGLAEGTYYLVETEAPDGYNPLSNPITATISTNAEGGPIAADGTIQITVTNKKGFALPSTGGMGTMLFTVGGLVLIVAAVSLLILARRKEREKDIDR